MECSRSVVLGREARWRRAAGGEKPSRESPTTGRGGGGRRLSDTLEVPRDHRRGAGGRGAQAQADGEDVPLVCEDSCPPLSPSRPCTCYTSPPIYITQGTELVRTHVCSLAHARPASQCVSVFWLGLRTKKIHPSLIPPPLPSLGCAGICVYAVLTDTLQSAFLSVFCMHSLREELRGRGGPGLNAHRSEVEALCPPTLLPLHVPNLSKIALARLRQLPALLKALYGRCLCQQPRAMQGATAGVAPASARRALYATPGGFKEVVSMVTAEAVAPEPERDLPAVRRKLGAALYPTQPSPADGARPWDRHNSCPEGRLALHGEP
ncbi:hypothetical protein AAFF_G00283720 [Aldrovandia affinis]|uniref:Uncharacterized protein n=1 Tax=Aldrovandia affinis TaxID=143900 RepID=A0AAD7TA41_9TELE|nr:hypothetical protein AAFF_G00283720 [Aldrovandia affinis]